MRSVSLSSVVCIIGAGPAGAATSIFLSKAGIPHIIVDAAVFPRDKVCGDGLDTKSIRMLNHIDPNIIPNEIFVNDNFTPSWGIRSITPKGKIRDFCFQPDGDGQQQVPFFVSKRFYFDDFLLKKINPSNAVLLQGTKVKSLVRDGKYWKVLATNTDEEITITCEMLVGADGDHSVVLRHLGDRKINRKHYAGSVRQYWKGIEGLHEKKLLEFYYPNDKPMGYFWIFPLANGEANVGYGITSEIAAKYNFNIRNTFKEIIEKDKAISHRFRNATPVGEAEGWGIPLASLQRKVVGDGWLLAGDAASMVSPNTGEGIGTAMMTGYIAAKFIEKGMKAGNFSEDTLANYSREVYKRMHGEIKNYEFSFKYPGISNGLINYAIGDNFIWQQLFKHTMKGWLRTAYQTPVQVEL